MRLYFACYIFSNHRYRPDYYLHFYLITKSNLHRSDDALSYIRESAAVLAVAALHCSKSSERIPQCVKQLALGVIWPSRCWYRMPHMYPTVAVACTCGVLIVHKRGLAAPGITCVNNPWGLDLQSALLARFLFPQDGLKITAGQRQPHPGPKRVHPAHQRALGLIMLLIIQHESFSASKKNSHGGYNSIAY